MRLTTSESLEGNHKDYWPVKTDGELQDHGSCRVKAATTPASLYPCLYMIVKELKDNNGKVSEMIMSRFVFRQRIKRYRQRGSRLAIPRKVYIMTFINI